MGMGSLYVQKFEGTAQGLQTYTSGKPFVPIY